MDSQEDTELQAALDALMCAPNTIQRVCDEPARKLLKLAKILRLPISYCRVNSTPPYYCLMYSARSQAAIEAAIINLQNETSP